jgi:hypothetical protein
MKRLKVIEATFDDFISYRILPTLKLLRLAILSARKQSSTREELERSNYLGVDRQRTFSAPVNLNFIFS